MIFKRELNKLKDERFKEVWKFSQDKAKNGIKNLFCHTPTGAHRALTQAHEARIITDVTKMVNNSQECKDGMIKCLYNMGVLIESKESPFDYKYLSHLNRFNKNNQLSLLRGADWLKYNPKKTKAKTILKSKQKPGRKVKNIGMY